MANKFGARKTVVDGMRFDSMAEARRYRELQLMEKAGVISELVCHPRYRIEVNGSRVCEVIPDFRYQDNDAGRMVVEDVKSLPTRTPVYRLKKRLLQAVHGIEIQEYLAG
jgi:hypothetical protein